MKTLLAIVCLACLAGCAPGSCTPSDSEDRKIIFANGEISVIRVADPFGGTQQCFILYNGGAGRGGMAPYNCPNKEDN